MKRIAIYTLLLWVATPFAMHSQQPASKLSARAMTRIAAPAETRTEATISAYINVDPARLDRESLDRLGVKITLDAGDIVTARLPLSSLAKLADVEGVEYVETASQVTPMLDMARPEVGIDKVNSGSALDHPFTGSGVVVGIVDAGFDYTHAAFRDSDGNLRIKRVWEQNSTPSGTQSSPEGFGYGVEFATPGDIEAAGGDIRNNSHGTHVAAIATGSDGVADGTLRGMAPEADIVLVSFRNDNDNGNVNISDAISYIFNYAEAEGKPCVINLSLGAHDGPHDGTSTFDVIADRLQGPGRLIVGSAGNHRADHFHATKTFNGEGEETLKTFLDFKGGLSTSSAGAALEVWGSEGMDIEVALLAVNTSTGATTDRVVVYPVPTDGEPTATISLGRNISGDLTVASEVSPLNGKPHVHVTSNIRSIRTNYAAAIEVTSSAKGQVDIWADNTKLNLASRDIEGFSAPEGPTIAEIGGTATRILTVGAYTTRSRYTLINETTEHTLNETDGDLSSFSSCGPTADGRMKPEVTAPGCFIRSAVSNNDASGTLYISLIHTAFNRDNMYGFMQGTSMSSPHVAGVVATWLEACPSLTPEQLKEIVSLTSRSDAFTGNIGEGGNSMWGYGKVDAYAGLKESLRLNAEGGIDAIKPGAAGPAVSLNADLLQILMTASATNATVSIYNTAGGLEMQQSWSALRAGDELTMSLSPLPAGVHIITVDTPSSRTTTKLVK